MSAAVTAAGSIYGTLASGAGECVDLAANLVGWRGKGAEFAGSFPARHVVFVKLHELNRRGQRLLLVAELEVGVAADHFFGFDEWAFHHAEFAVPDPPLPAPADPHQATALDHAARLDHLGAVTLESNPGRLPRVTGRSRGLGADLARELAKDGHDLILSARRLEPMRVLADELKALGANCTIIAADLSKSGAVAALV